MNNEAIARRILEMHLVQELAIRKCRGENEKNSDQEIAGDLLQDAIDTFDVIDLVADIVGCPPDNTEETDAVDYANLTGEWPEWGVCRDWQYDAWEEVVQGNHTIDQFMEELQQAVDAHPSC